MYTMRCSLLVSESKWLTLAFVLHYRNSSRFSHRAQATPPNVSIASITLDGSGFECTHLTVIDSDMTCPRVTPPVVFQNQWVPFRCHVCPYATPVGLLVRLWSTHASWACDIHLMPWCLPGWASLVDKLEVIVHFFTIYHTGFFHTVMRNPSLNCLQRRRSLAIIGHAGPRWRISWLSILFRSSLPSCPFSSCPLCHSLCPSVVFESCNVSRPSTYYLLDNVYDIIYTCLMSYPGITFVVA